MGSREQKCVYERTEDEPRSGRPLANRTPEIIEKVRQTLAQDQRLTLSLIAGKLCLSKDTALTIVRDDLDVRKICSGFVSHKLTDDYLAKRIETSGDFIFMCDQDLPLLVENIVTGD